MSVHSLSLWLVQVTALSKNTAPFHVRAAPPKPVEQPRAPAVPEPPSPTTNNVADSNNDHTAGYFHLLCCFELLTGKKCVHVHFSLC